ncbi:MAG TPA: hypothetical protein VIM17_04430 [Jatrophihabitantaceae bacterium]
MSASSVEMWAPWPVVARPVCDLLCGHGEQDGGRDPAAVGQQIGAQQHQHRVLDGVVVALAGGARVARAVHGRDGPGQGVQDGKQRLGADRGQLAFHVTGAVGALPDGEVAAAGPVVFAGVGAVGVEGVADPVCDLGQQPRVELPGLLDQEVLHRVFVLGLYRRRQCVDGAGDDLGVPGADRPGRLRRRHYLEQWRQCLSGQAAARTKISRGTYPARSLDRADPQQLPQQRCGVLAGVLTGQAAGPGLGD